MSTAKSNRDKQADLRDRTRAAVIYGDAADIKALPDSALIEAVRIAYKGDNGGRGPDKRLTYSPSPFTLAVVVTELMTRANARADPDKRVTVTIGSVSETAITVTADDTATVTVTQDTHQTDVTVTKDEPPRTDAELVAILLDRHRTYSGVARALAKAGHHVDRSNLSRIHRDGQMASTETRAGLVAECEIEEV